MCVGGGGEQVTNIKGLASELLDTNLCTQEDLALVFLKKQTAFHMTHQFYK